MKLTATATAKDPPPANPPSMHSSQDAAADREPRLIQNESQRQKEEKCLQVFFVDKIADSENSVPLKIFFLINRFDVQPL